MTESELYEDANYVENVETVDEMTEDTVVEQSLESNDVVPEEKIENPDEEVQSESPEPEIEDEPETPSVSLEDVTALLSSLSQKMDEMNDLFTEKIKRSASDDRVIADMHNELEMYKDDFYRKLLKPILLDLIDFRDSITKLATAKRQKPQSEQIIPLKTFEMYALDILDILERYGALSYNSTEGDDFTPIKQKIARTVATGDKELHGKIAESLSDGYLFEEKVLIPERVAAYSYDANLAVASIVPLEEENHE